VLRIERLRSSPVNATPILTHRVRINEVQDVVDGDDIVETGHSGRDVLIGPTAAGRTLAVVLEPEGGGVAPRYGSPGEAEPAPALGRAPRRRTAMTQAQTAKRPVPTFRSREEATQFWEDHDPTEYVDFADDATFATAGPLSQRVALEIDAETTAEVEAIAAEQGVPPGGLPSVWILERRDAERQRRAAVAARTATVGNGAAATG